MKCYLHIRILSEVGDDRDHHGREWDVVDDGRTDSGDPEDEEEGGRESVVDRDRKDGFLDQTPDPVKESELCQCLFKNSNCRFV
jgi:hypothetical protein